MTSRAFCGDPRKYFALALASIALSNGTDKTYASCGTYSSYSSLLRCGGSGRRSSSSCRRYFRSLLRLLGFRSRVPFKSSRRRKLTQFVAAHVLSDVDRNVALAVVHPEGQADHVR